MASKGLKCHSFVTDGAAMMMVIPLWSSGDTSHSAAASSVRRMGRAGSHSCRYRRVADLALLSCRNIVEQDYHDLAGIVRFQRQWNGI